MQFECEKLSTGAYLYKAAIWNEYVVCYSKTSNLEGHKPLFPFEYKLLPDGFTYQFYDYTVTIKVKKFRRSVSLYNSYVCPKLISFSIYINDLLYVTIDKARREQIDVRAINKLVTNMKKNRQCGYGLKEIRKITADDVHIHFTSNPFDSPLVTYSLSNKIQTTVSLDSLLFKYSNNIRTVLRHSISHQGFEHKLLNPQCAICDSETDLEADHIGERFNTIFCKFLLQEAASNHPPPVKCFTQPSWSRINCQFVERFITYHREHSKYRTLCHSCHELHTETQKEYISEECARLDPILFAIE